MSESEVIDATHTALAIRRSLDQINGALAEFEKIEAGFLALESAHPANLACLVMTPQGMKEAIAGRAAWREPRIATEKARKAGKAPVLALGRDIDARAAELTERLEAGEANYDDQIKAGEAARAVEKARKEQAERERIAAHQTAIEEIHMAAHAAVGHSSAAICVILGKVESIETATGFEEFRPMAQRAKTETLAKLETLRDAALAQEAEAARLAAERAELERLRAEADAREKAERDRIAEQHRAEAARLAAERAELDRQQAAAKAEQERIAREALAARQAADAQAAAERAEADRQAKAVRDAEEMRQREERAKQQAELDAQAATLRAQQAEADRVAREARLAQEQQEAAERASAAAAAQEKADADRAAKQAAEDAERQARAQAAAAQNAMPRVEDDDEMLAIHARFLDHAERLLSLEANELHILGDAVIEYQDAAYKCGLARGLAEARGALDTHESPSVNDNAACRQQPGDNA